MMSLLCPRSTTIAVPFGSGPVTGPSLEQRSVRVPGDESSPPSPAVEPSPAICEAHVVPSHADPSPGSGVVDLGLPELEHPRSARVAIANRTTRICIRALPGNISLSRRTGDFRVTRGAWGTQLDSTELDHHPRRYGRCSKSR